MLYPENLAFSIKCNITYHNSYSFGEHWNWLRSGQKLAANEDYQI